MSYWKQTQIVDDLGFISRCTPANELRVVEPFRLAGSTMEGTVVNPTFWTSTLVGTGTVTQANGLQTLATGATANSSVIVNSTTIARFVGQNENIYAGIIQLGDTGTANNERGWGAANSTDGAYFKINGTTVYICTKKGGVETAVASTSWNGNQTVPTLTNLNTYRVEYRLKAVIFEINGVVAHTVSTTSSRWSNTSNLPIIHYNTNSGGSTTNVSMNVASATIYRMGPFQTQPIPGRITTAGTYNLKYGPGTLHRIVLNNPTGTLITVYDNTVGSGTTLAVLNTPSQANPVCLDYGIVFNTGLTVVSTGTWDATISYE